MHTTPLKKAAAALFLLSTLLVLSLLLWTFAPPAMAGPYGELIKIDESSMSAIYPAVWFSPERGKVAALTNMSDTPPSPEFTMWIEPRDPEIALGDNAGGFALLGQGDDAYNYPSISSSLKFEGRIASSQIKPGNVFVCRTEGKTYLMKVVSLDTEAQKLSFLWKCQDC